MSWSLGMEILLEIHEQDELDKVNQYVNIVGVNNRNLKTFEVNTDISVATAEKIPKGFLTLDYVHSRSWAEFALWYDHYSTAIYFITGDNKYVKRLRIQRVSDRGKVYVHT